MNIECAEDILVIILNSGSYTHPPDLIHFENTPIPQVTRHTRIPYNYYYQSLSVCYVVIPSTSRLELARCDCLHLYRKARVLMALILSTKTTDKPFSINKLEIRLPISILSMVDSRKLIINYMSL